MDLGATVCTRLEPRASAVRSPRLRRAARGPHRRAAGAARAQRAAAAGSAWLVLRRNGAVLLERRPSSGIWGGLWCFPEHAGPRAGRRTAARCRSSTASRISGCASALLRGAPEVRILDRSDDAQRRDPDACQNLLHGLAGNRHATRRSSERWSRAMPKMSRSKARPLLVSGLPQAAQQSGYTLIGPTTSAQFRRARRRSPAAPASRRAAAAAARPAARSPRRSSPGACGDARAASGCCSMHALEQPHAARRGSPDRSIASRHRASSTRRALQAVGLHAALEDAEALLAAATMTCRRPSCGMSHSAMRGEAADVGRHRGRADFLAFADQAHAEGRVVAQAGLAMSM